MSLGWEGSGAMTIKSCGRSLQPSLNYILYRWFKLSFLSMLQGQCSSELRISEWFASQSGHAIHDSLFNGIPPGLLHSTHICNAFSCLRLRVLCSWNLVHFRIPSGVWWITLEKVNYRLTLKPEMFSWFSFP